MSAVVEFLLAHGLELVGGLSLLLIAVIGVLKIIPGDQGEEKLQKIVDFLTRLIQPKP